MNASNPFAPFFKAYTDMSNACAFNSPENNPFGYSPTAGLQQGYETARKNYQAASNAGRAFSDMTQTVARRQAEFTQQFVEAYSGYLQQVAGCKNPQESLKTNTQFAQNVSNNALSNSREIAEIITKSSNEVADIVSERLSEALNDITEATDSAAGRAANAFNNVANPQSTGGAGDSKKKAA